MKLLIQPTLKMTTKALLYFVGGVLSLYHVTVQAQGTSNTTAARETTSQISSVQKLQVQQAAQQASEWGLKAEEWQRYEELMQGRLGVYSPGIDPLTALGIEARNEEERRHYAELQVFAEAARVERELAYQRAYDEAWKRLFADLMPLGDMVGMSATAMTPSIMSGSSNRLAVFVQNDCVPCEQKVQQLQNAGTSFDLYMVGSHADDAVIRRWATKVGIDSGKVLSRQITLNHDDGKWDAIEEVIGPGGSLPAVVKEVEGMWQRQ